MILKKYSFLINGFFGFVLISLSLSSFYLAYLRYINYVFGKFDLGNMNQMLYNSTRFNFMVLTDYFGSNNIRWSMSHVDPLILLLIPLNFIYSDALLLLVVQNVCFILSSLLVFKIARNYKISIINSWLISIILYLMPMSGFILVWTTFHPSVLSLPIFFLIYYLLLQNQLKKLPKFFTRNIFIFSLSFCTFLFVLGKEELGVVFAFFIPLLINKFPNEKSLLIKLGIISFLWSLVCLLVIIPFYSNARNLSTQNFIKDSKIEVDVDKFSNANYFLYRYSELGDSYGEIVGSIILNPESFISILVSETSLNTLNQILLPNIYSIFINPYLLISFVPETLIQMLSADPEVFSITNHRLIVVIPSLMLGLVYLSIFLEKKLKKYSYIIFFLLILLNVFLSIQYKSPFLYPVSDKITKIITLQNNRVFADTNSKIEFKNDITRQCPDYLLSLLNENDSVSVPQPLGAKTSNRKFNALFPTGVKNSNVIISDIYDRKIVDFLKIPETANKKIVKRAIADGGFSLVFSCDRFFFLKKGYSRSDLGDLTILEANKFIKNESQKLTKNSYYDSGVIEITNSKINFDYKYFVGDEESRNALFNYTIITNGENYWQFVHLPSYYLKPIEDVPVNSLVEEKFTLPIPSFLPKGKYNVYFGMGNKRENNNNLKIAEINL